MSFPRTAHDQALKPADGTRSQGAGPGLSSRFQGIIPYVFKHAIMQGARRPKTRMNNNTQHFNFKMHYRIQTQKKMKNDTAPRTQSSNDTIGTRMPATSTKMQHKDRNTNTETQSNHSIPTENTKEQAKMRCRRAHQCARNYAKNNTR